MNLCFILYDIAPDNYKPKELSNLVSNAPTFTYLDIREVERRKFCQNDSSTA